MSHATGCNANDGPAGGDQARWERLFSPLVTVPNNAQYLTVEFDVCYDTENDPVLPVLGYDGFFLRITDQTVGRTLRSVLAEAFEQEFTTDGFQITSITSSITGLLPTTVASSTSSGGNWLFTGRFRPLSPIMGVPVPSSDGAPGKYSPRPAP